MAVNVGNSYKGECIMKQNKNVKMSYINLIVFIVSNIKSPERLKRIFEYSQRMFYEENATQQSQEPGG